MGYRTDFKHLSESSLIGVILNKKFSYSSHKSEICFILLNTLISDLYILNNLDNYLVSSIFEEFNILFQLILRFSEDCYSKVCWCCIKIKDLDIKLEISFFIWLKEDVFILGNSLGQM